MGRQTIYATGLIVICAEEKSDLGEDSPEQDMVVGRWCSWQRRWAGHSMSEHFLCDRRAGRRRCSQD